MNELRRMAYLDALGIDSYVSRSQLPGAALTRRLAIASACAATVTACCRRRSRCASTYQHPQTARMPYHASELSRSHRTAVLQP